MDWKARSSVALATEVEQFGIKITVVEPGFFRTDLLDARNVKYAQSSIADYGHEGPAEAMWSPYDGKQPGDPDKFGLALVQLARMAAPPKVFVAGRDGIDLIRPVIEGRLQDMRDHEALSSSTAIDA
jgi:NAD(P)-dependent dehydrogenase (short-subunit alcohol dehydrogenase family)